MGKFLELAMAGGELAEQIEEGSPPSPLPEEAQPCPVNDDPLVPEINPDFLPGDLPPSEPSVQPTPDLGGHLPLDPDNPLGGEEAPPPQEPDLGGEQLWGDERKCRVTRRSYETVQAEKNKLRAELIIMEEDELENQLDIALLKVRLREVLAIERSLYLRYLSLDCMEVTGEIPPPG